MSFTGRDYHYAFEEACQTLAHTSDNGEVRSALEGMEWILWEAIRGVFFTCAVVVAGPLVMIPYFTLSNDRTFADGAIALAISAVVAAALYWLFRLSFALEISRQVKGRTFGDGGLGRRATAE